MVEIFVKEPLHGLLRSLWRRGFQNLALYTKLQSEAHKSLREAAAHKSLRKARVERDVLKTSPP